MPEHDLEKLLGGFAADQLTAEERQMLYRAALDDQRLFNALADEQALKELLTDPAVRNTLLHVLNKHHTQGSRRWLDRVMRPSTVVWAGGVAVGVFAVVLGINVYEDSLRQATHTAALEDGRSPASAPPSQAPGEEIKSSKPRQAAPTPEPATRVPSNKNLDRPEPPASRPRKGIGRDTNHETTEGRAKEKMPTDPATTALGKSAEEPAASRERPARPSSPTAGLNPDTLLETGAGPAAGASARALFHAGSATPEQMRSTLQEREAKPEPKPERFALTQKALDSAEPVKPLAFRYRIITEKRQSASESAVDRPGVVRFTVESNQDAYLQIWRSSGESLPELVLPAKETGRISLKTAAAQPQEITVEGETDRLMVRVSRVPFGPITRQEAVMAGRAVQGQVVESVMEREEPATYVANPDASVADLAADISLSPRR